MMMEMDAYVRLAKALMILVHVLNALLKTVRLVLNLLINQTVTSV